MNARTVVSSISLALASLLAALSGCGGSGEPPCHLLGCDGARLCQKPDDPGAPGSWPVGARTVLLDGRLRTEVWYPARFGSASGRERLVYDVRQELPPEERLKIPNDANPWRVCECYADLPIDDRHGPYPLLVFLHGTASFRMQNLAHATLWASRGFVVVAADYPGLMLADILFFQGSADLPADTRRLLELLREPQGELSFLAGVLDVSRVGMAGHSAGGMAIAGFADEPGVRVLIPMAAEGAAAGASLESVLVVGAIDDKVVPYARQVAGYQGSPRKKRLLGLSNAGHLAPTDLCALENSQGQDLVEVAKEYQITNASLAELLWDGCAPGQLDPHRGAAIVGAATTAVFEETLQCRPAGTFLSGIRDAFSEVGEYREEL